jgi:hypothetical protein
VQQKTQRAVNTKVTNMSLIVGIKKEGIGLTFPLFFLAQMKRKRHIEKQREGKSVRLSARQRGF